MTTLMPRLTVPDLTVATLDQGDRFIAQRSPREFMMVVVDRGLHCPICRGYLGVLRRLLPDWRGAAATSLPFPEMTSSRLNAQVTKWKLEGVNIGHGFELETARR